MWLRNLLAEIGMHDMLKEPTVLFSDSSGAIDWMRFRKVSPSNHYILISYHQRNEWVESGDIVLHFKRGVFNTADILTKAASRQVFLRLMMKYLGYNLIVPEGGEIQVVGSTVGWTHPDPMHGFDNFGAS